MIQPTKITKHLSSYFFLFFISLAFAQDSKSSVASLPESVFGEWQGDTGNGEYDGLLIHSAFIEFGYRPFKYQDIRKDESGVYHFSAKDSQGNTMSYQLEVLANDSINLKTGDRPYLPFVKHKDPLQSKRVTMADVPNAIKKNWFTMDGENTLEFSFENQKLVFRNKAYTIEEVVDFKSNSTGEYRFIVKNENDYRMFYFKNWDDNYMQIGFNGKAGDLYKASKDYPDYKIDNMSAYLNSVVPKALRGNWLKADGSNVWAFSFHYDNAVLDRVTWNYKSINKKGRLYVITLEHKNEEKTIYAQLNKDATVNFGTNKKDLITYTTSKINNPNIKLANDEPYTEDDLFKIGSATYSGIIRGFSAESKEKTGMVHVDNVYTGNQDSYLVKIQNDGSFSVKFPLYYPMQVFVRFPNYNESVFMAPGKETWQLIDTNNLEGAFFAGDAVQMNTDFNSLSVILRDYSFYTDVARKIDQFTLETFKEECYARYQNKIKKRDSVINTQFISNKARQVFDLELDYQLYVNLLSYDMYSRDGISAKIDSAYLSFLTPEIYNNKLAVVTYSFSSFINYLKFSGPFRANLSVTNPDPFELAEILKSDNVELSDEEKELIHIYEKHHKENAPALQKQKEFREKHQEALDSFGRKLTQFFQATGEEDRQEISNEKGLDFDLINSIIKSKGLPFTFSKEELAVQKAQENLLTIEEKTTINKVNTSENYEKSQEFIKKHQTYVNTYIQNEFKKRGIEQVRRFLGHSFTADVIMAQTILGNMTQNFIPLTDTELIASQKEIEHPFIAKVIKTENDLLKSKIEANKSKSGFIVNETPNTDADKVFDAIISKHVGKVIFVDFWATWCGPCISGMKEMMPLKEELEGKDLVFVYITDPSSPETTYNNMVTNIKGEHYRLSQDEWNHLAGKFNISGIPHYLLLDKSGAVVKDNTSDLRMTHTLKGLLETELNKEVR